MLVRHNMPSAGAFSASPVMTHSPVEMDEYTSFRCEQLEQYRNRVIKPLQIRINTASPNVSICLLLNDGRLFEKLFICVRNFRSEGEIRSRIKWRVNVDEVHLSRELRQQRRQDILLVAPDEPIAPLGLPA